MKKASSLRMLAFFMACMVVITTCFTVSISAIWDYDDEGTGMPAPDDENQGLPYPDANDEYAITEYSFKYTPSVLDASSKAVLANAKAGDVVLLKIALTDIDIENNPLGMSAFQGTVTYDVEDIDLFLNCDESFFEEWFANCIKFTPDEGMRPNSSITVNKNVCWTVENPAPDWYPEEEAGYGIHWSFNIDKNNAGTNGVMTDTCLELIFPVKIDESVEDGAEYTFTVPFPVYENMGTEYVKSGDFKSLYASGGAYTLTIKNHADVDANIASDSVYAIAPIGGEFGEKSNGYLNDKLIPLTENSKYFAYQENVAIGMDFLAPADVNGVTVTFNDTNDADLPASVIVYGVDAEGNKVLLGTANEGVAFDEGFSFNSGYYEETDTIVNAANAYKYTVSGFDVASYTGIYVEAMKADGASMVAVGEIEVNGEYTKFNVTIENGTIENAAQDNNYLPGTELSITANDIPGKNFIGWEVAEGGAGEFADATATSTTFTVGAATTVIVAVYEDVLYNLTVENGTGSGEYAMDSVVDITADAPAYGKVFSHWEVVSGDAVIADTTAASTTVTTAIGDSAIKAVYVDAPRYAVYVDYGSIATQPDEGFEGYLAGTVVTLVPPTANELPEGKVFIGWTTLCGTGTLDSANNTFTVGTGDAEIFAVLVDMHKPVEDNLAPNATFTLLEGTAADLTYINDQLYPLLAEGKWVPVTISNNKITFIAKLDDVYDITGASFTIAVDPATRKFPPMSIQFYGANTADGSDKVVLATLSSSAIEGNTNYVQFDEGVNLTSIAAKFDVEVDPALIGAYEYVVIECGCMAQLATVYNFGEIEIFGTESKFAVSIENGKIEAPTADGLYNDGDVITIVADEIADKVFVGWTLENAGVGEFADSSAATTTFTVGKGDNKIIAVYRDVLYPLTVNKGTGSGEYVRGSQVVITADNSNDAELVFDKWIVVSGSAAIADPANATTTVTTDGEAVIEATYKYRVYDLTVENGTGTGNYAKGTVVDIAANAAPADMVFSHWMIVTGSGTLEDANSANTKFTTSNEATTLRAVYVDVLYSVDVEGGKIITDDDANKWKVGTQLNIEAIIPEHKTFVKWEIVSGAGSFANATDANTTFTTGSGDTVIKAVFEDVEYTLTVENGLGGGKYIYDAVADITANIPDGYLFAGWEVVEGDVEIDDAYAAETKVTIKGDATIKATFVEKEYTVDIINGKVDDDDKADTYKKGTVITIIADDADENMHFKGWVIVSGEATIADASSAETTITVGSSDVVIRAEYADDLYTITVENGTATGINEDGNKVGDVITIVADEAPEGKMFDKWEIVSGEGTLDDENSAETTFTLGAANTVIRATYKEDKTTPTGDSGMAVFGLLAIAGLIGTAVVLKKKKD